MLNNEGQAATATALLPPIDAANTAAATGGWVAVSDYEGDLVITQSVGVVTAGSITGKVQQATDSGGTGAADVSGAAFTAVTTANDPLLQKLTIPANSIGPYIRYVGTIVTGPAAVSASLLARSKSV